MLSADLMHVEMRFICVEKFRCFQQTVYIPAFLSAPYHIGRELSDGSQCQIFCVEYVCLFIQKPYEQIQVVAVTADSLWCILSDFDI